MHLAVHHAKRSWRGLPYPWGSATPLQPGLSDLDARGRRKVSPAGPAGHPGGIPSTVGPLDNRSGADDAVDSVEGVGVKVDHRPYEQVLELLVGPRTEDRGGDRGVDQREGDGHMGEGQARLLGDLRQLVQEIQLALVARAIEVI